MPARSLVAGMPAKVVRQLSEQEIAWKGDGTRTYHDLARRSLESMYETAPLTSVEADRKRIQVPGVIPLVELKNAVLKPGRGPAGLRSGNAGPASTRLPA